AAAPGPRVALHTAAAPGAAGAGAAGRPGGRPNRPGNGSTPPRVGPAPPDAPRDGRRVVAATHRHPATEAVRARLAAWSPRRPGRNRAATSPGSDPPGGLDL